jgi:hypothetical protein
VREEGANEKFISIFKYGKEKKMKNFLINLYKRLDIILTRICKAVSRR